MVYVIVNNFMSISKDSLKFIQSLHFLCVTEKK